MCVYVYNLKQNFISEIIILSLINTFGVKMFGERERDVRFSNEIPEMSDLIESHKYTDTPERMRTRVLGCGREREMKLTWQSPGIRLHLRTTLSLLEECNYRANVASQTLHVRQSKGAFFRWTRLILRELKSWGLIEIRALLSFHFYSFFSSSLTSVLSPNWTSCRLNNQLVALQYEQVHWDFLTWVT